MLTATVFLSYRFRAAARSAEIHRDNYAQVIQAMGAIPKSIIATPVVKAIIENLELAREGVAHEGEALYSDFIQQAGVEGNQDAVLLFIYAKDAEAENSQFYTEALNNLKAWREATRPFYVCLASGQMNINLEDTTNCPESNREKQFETIF